MSTLFSKGQCATLSLSFKNIFLANSTQASLHSKRFRGAKSEEQGFWCFALMKNGARAKIRRGWFIFCTLLIYHAAKTGSLRC